MFPTSKKLLKLFKWHRPWMGVWEWLASPIQKSSVNMMEMRDGPLFMLNMSEFMNNIIEFNQDKQTLTFEAGASLYDVTTALESYNRSYATFASGVFYIYLFAMCHI